MVGRYIFVPFYVQINRNHKQDDVSSTHTYARIARFVFVPVVCPPTTIQLPPCPPPRIQPKHLYINQTRHTQKLSFILINILVYITGRCDVVHLYIYVRQQHPPCTIPPPPYTNILRRRRRRRPLHATQYIYATRISYTITM